MANIIKVGTVTVVTADKFKELVAEADNRNEYSNLFKLNEGEKYTFAKDKKFATRDVSRTENGTTNIQTYLGVLDTKGRFIPLSLFKTFNKTDESDDTHTEVVCTSVYPENISFQDILNDMQGWSKDKTFTATLYKAWQINARGRGYWSKSYRLK